jgi:hypothetical protein
MDSYISETPFPSFMNAQLEEEISDSNKGQLPSKTLWHSVAMN